MKVICFFLGYLIVKLGYNLINTGVKGEFNFTSEYKGIKAGLVSSSPGLLFVLLGTCLIAYAIFVEKPYHYDNGSTTATTISKPDSIYKPLLTDTIPPYR
ncbi:hypothetical protein SAMN05428947_10353 [Mucilaginibacter sp. OK283]|jgi:hypothetical protein|nr:hypothetical protein SAMN05428947_10353 [Mucilaginibacter sp. OK283]